MSLQILTYGTNCGALIADLILYSYEADYIQGLLKKSEKKLVWSYNYTFSYIDDVLLQNNSKLGDLVDGIYPIDLEIKNTTDQIQLMFVLYLDLHPLWTFPAAPAYGVNISQSDIPELYDFLNRVLLLTSKLLNKEFPVANFKSSLQKFYGNHYVLVIRYKISVSQMTTDIFRLS